MSGEVGFAEIIRGVQAKSDFEEQIGSEEPTADG